MTMSDTDALNFQVGFQMFCEFCRANAQEHGFESKQNVGEAIALMHSELSEALEGLRKPQESDHIPGFTLVEEELADTIIRIGHFASAHDLRLGKAIIAKMLFNHNRPYKHGKQF